MNEITDGPRVRAPLSAREAKDLAIAVRAESRRIRDAHAQRKETRSAVEAPPGGTPPISGDESRALLERCQAAREVSRYLAGSARAARHAAGEQVRSLERRVAGGFLSAGLEEDGLTTQPSGNREKGR